MTGSDPPNVAGQSPTRPKSLKFAPRLIEPILNGAKTKTWRVNDDKAVSEGDILILTDPEGKGFAKARVTAVKLTTLGKGTPEDHKGNERFESEESMYQTFSKYYRIKAYHDTPVKVITFEVIEKTSSEKTA